MRARRSDTGSRRSEWVSVPCAGCGASVDRRASEVRQTVYCSLACSRSNPFKGSPGRPRTEVDGRYYTKGGHVRLRVEGRLVFEHVVVVSEYLGREPGAGEIVHHIDLVPDNNALGNLALMTRSEHNSLHHALRALAGTSMFETLRTSVTPVTVAYPGPAARA